MTYFKQQTFIHNIYTEKAEMRICLKLPAKSWNQMAIAMTKKWGIVKEKIRTGDFVAWLTSYQDSRKLHCHSKMKAKWTFLRLTQQVQKPVYAFKHLLYTCHWELMLTSQTHQRGIQPNEWTFSLLLIQIFLFSCCFFK